MSAGSRLVGTVKSWKDRWGFLVSDEVQGDIFVHARENPELGGSLSMGEQVIFDLTAGKDGQPHAMNASRPGAAISASPLIGSSGGAGMTGVLASFRDGWGLIECPSLVEKLYCGVRDNPGLTSQNIVVGDEVQFELGTNPSNGKSKAMNTCLMVKEQFELVGQRCSGVVKSFRDGWGFATSSRFSGTIMLGKKNIAASGLGWLQVGAPVEFEVGAGNDGKFEAMNISSFASVPAVAMGPPPMSYGGCQPDVPMLWRSPMHASAPAYGSAHSGMAPSYGRGPFAQVNGGPIGGGSLPGYGGKGAAGARDRSRTPAAGGPFAQRVIGTVRTFRGDWGFIQSDSHEGDIYVNASAVPGLDGPLEPGETVEFEIDHRPGSHNGARAANVVRLDGGVQAYSPAPPPMVALVHPRPYAWATAPPMQAAAPPPPPMGKGCAKGYAPGPGQKHTGTVADVKETWVWVRTASVTGDVFLGMRDNAQLSALPAVGDELSFELKLDPKSGRYKAINAVPSLAGQRVQGTITQVRDGGWGFASSEGVVGAVMIGKRNLTASGIQTPLQVGDVLEYDLNVAAKGYEALNIQMVAAHF